MRKLWLTGLAVTVGMAAAATQVVGVTVEHGPPKTVFSEAKDPRTKEFLSQIL